MQGSARSRFSDRVDRKLHQCSRDYTVARLPRRSFMRAAAEDDSVQLTDGDGDSAMAATRSQRTLAIAGLAAAAIIVTVFLSREGFNLQQTVDAIQIAVRDHPTAGPLIFVAAYAVAAVVLIPGAAILHCTGSAQQCTVCNPAPAAALTVRQAGILECKGLRRSCDPLSLHP